MSSSVQPHWENCSREYWKNTRPSVFCTTQAPSVNSFLWQDIGYASDVEKALDEFAKKVLKDGLDSTRTESLEAEFIRRTEALETTVNEDHKPRIETIEDTLAEKVPQLDATNPILKINSRILIFDCGTASPRAYLGE